MVPLSEPREYVGKCAAKDFRAPQSRLSESMAEADVAEHLAEVKARPHRPYVAASPRFLGMCDAGDFTATELRTSWSEAEAGVAEHVAQMHPPQDGL